VPELLNRRFDPIPHLPAVAIAPVEHPASESRCLGSGTLAAPADQQIGGAPNGPIGNTDNFERRCHRPGSPPLARPYILYFGQVGEDP
jgi:hypothetical protein